MRKVMIIMSIIFIGMLIPLAFSTDTSQIVITYGETTHVNQEYKNIVDSFFVNQSNINLNDANSKIITADEVNKISSSITGKNYNSNQIFSSALLDLRDSDDLKVTIDKSKINTITADMYMSALKTAGITQGHVYVTSPISATGESALSGIMNSYEVATNVEIPESVKEVANDEIYTQAEIVKNSNVDADELSDLVDDIKETVKEDNITDHNTIVNIINNYTTNNNINITNNDIENLADVIEQIQNVQGDLNEYENEISDLVNNSDTTSLQDLLGGLIS